MWPITTVSQVQILPPLLCKESLMPVYVTLPIKQGTKVHCHIEGNPKDLARMAERLKVKAIIKPLPVPHVNITTHKADVALRYGAQVMESEQ